MKHHVGTIQRAVRQSDTEDGSRSIEIGPVSFRVRETRKIFALVRFPTNTQARILNIVVQYDADIERHGP